MASPATSPSPGAPNREEARQSPPTTQPPEAANVASAAVSDPQPEAGAEVQSTGAGTGAATGAQEAEASSSPQSQESGEASPMNDQAQDGDAPPLPNEPPPAEDDGWEFQWDATHQAYFFYNRITGATTWENPRLAQESTGTAAAPGTAPGVAEPPKDERPPAGGYNPAIHGDYDPNAWYAQGGQEEGSAPAPTVDAAAAYAAIGSFNRFTGRWQGDDQNPDNHNDESKSRRQMNAFFDVDAAANAHDGRSLKAERSGKKPSKTELKQFKEKRRAKKEEKRRAWLLD